ncbi:MAG: hypothetical protein WCV81_04560 [Microgenomates group bacterium]|jgi:hypothetical protein
MAETLKQNQSEEQPIKRLMPDTYRRNIADQVRPEISWLMRRDMMRCPRDGRR